MKLNLKTLAGIFAALLLTTNLFGQAQINTRREKLKDFASKTTKVVLSGDEILDEAIRESVANNWSASPYEFCSASDFDKLKSDANFYFLMVVKGQFRKEKEPGIDMLTLVKGGDGATVDDMVEVVTFPLRSTEQPSGREVEMLPAILKIIQDYTLSLTDSELKAYIALGANPKDLTKLKTKQIFFSKEDLAPQVDANVLKSLDEDIFIESDDDAVDDVLNSAQYNAVVSYTVAPTDPVEGSVCYKILIGADTHELYYYRKHRITARSGKGFLASDLKIINTIRK